MTKRPVKIIDTTLRDGSHAIHYQYSVEDVKNICKGLEESGVYAAEVGHGAGIGGSTLQYGLAKEADRDILTAAASCLKNTKLAVLLVPGLGTMDDLKAAYECGVRLVRVAVHCTELDVGMQHIKLGKELGMEVAAFFMMSHMISAEELAEQFKIAESYGVDFIYMADSSGAMVPEEITKRVKLLKEAVNVPIGVHCHNNLGLAVGNSLAAYESGADFVDTTLQGLGAGSGNTPTEATVAAFNKMQVETGCDLFKLMEVGEKYVRPLVQHSLEVTNESIILGYTGIYSSFYLPTIKTAKKFNVNPIDVLVELGKRKVVGGQEDMILDVAYELSKRKDV